MVISSNFLLWLCHLIFLKILILERNGSLVLIYYTTTKSKFLQVLRERFTYASRENDGCLVYSQTFNSYKNLVPILRGTENKQGWIERYNLESSPSTRNRHKKNKPVFDMVMLGEVKNGIKREEIEIPDFYDLTNNDFEMCNIHVCLVVTFPQDFYRVQEGKSALFDLFNQSHIDQVNKRIKKLIPNAEKFITINNIYVFKNYTIEKRKPKINSKQAENEYRRKLKRWEIEFAQSPETAGKKPKKSTPSQHEWTICLSAHAKKTIEDSLSHLVHLYEKEDKRSLFLTNVDRIHGFISKYNGHRGVRSDIGEQYGQFRRNFARTIKGVTLDEALQGHTLTLSYMGQLKDEYRNWGGNGFYDRDNLELMLLRAKDNYVYGNTSG